MMNHLTWDSFEAWVRQRHGTSDNMRLARTTTLTGDMHLTGDEAVDFIDRYFAAFSIAPGDYRFDRYFLGEGFNLIEVIHMVLSKKKRAKYERTPLTLGMLYQAALDGKWNCARLEALGTDPERNTPRDGGQSG
ncbi:DUF1493 family protein [Herbaspirillum rubrisubalbicans]|uniref:DUF1493 family protein n=1 Tax=Herbaspirillum rubrisubalbicans TaxID=80842 RepID=UPI0020A62AA6|nr:DUF1493 family protein [Herbaspirillum rubrisubalbicans]